MNSPSMHEIELAAEAAMNGDLLRYEQRFAATAVEALENQERQQIEDELERLQESAESIKGWADLVIQYLKVGDRRAAWKTYEEIQCEADLKMEEFPYEL